MKNNIFFTNSGKVSLDEIVALTGATLESSAEKNSPHEFSGVAPLETADNNDVSFLDNTKYLSQFETSKAGACFVRQKFASRAPKNMNLLITEEPYYAYALVAQKFYPRQNFEPQISAQAQIAKTVSLGKNVRIDSGVVIGENVKIADGCWIGSNTIIDNNVEIGEDTRIGGLCSLSHTLIGKSVIIHRGVHIGQDGFGFAAGSKGVTKVPQLGRVIIDDEVEIGSGTCIDRGAGHDTKIGHGSKIDNLVQIGHNVQIGRFTMIAAQTGIAGSSHIGDGVLIGGQVGLSGHITIGNKAKLAAQAGVMTDVPEGATYGGSPAVPIIDWHRQTAMIGKLIKKRNS